MVEPLVDHTPSLAQDSLVTEQLQALLDLVPDAVLVVAADNVIRHANQPAAVLFGRSPMELPGLPIERLLPALAAQLRVDGAAAMPVLSGSKADGTIFSAEVRLVHMPAPHAGDVIVLARDTANGQPQGTLVAERAIALAEFVDGIVHEINNSLAAALLFAETAMLMVDDPGKSASVKECLHSVIMSMRACGQTVRDVREQSRPRAIRPLT